MVIALTACGSTDTSSQSSSENTGSTDNQETPVKENDKEIEEVIEQPQPQTPVIKLGEVIAIDDFAEITVTNNSFGKRIDPPNPASFYSYYENKEAEETFLDTVITLKSLLTSAKSSDEFVDVKIVYDNKYEYRTFSAIEDNGGSDFTYTNITSIEPLKSGVLHFLASVPLAVESDGKPLKAVITINGTEYEQIIR